MPLPTTSLIHSQFEAHHRPTADGQLTAECAITRPASGSTTVWNDATCTSTQPTAATVYSGACRVQHLTAQPAVATVADRPVTAVRYRVSLPASAPAVQVGDVVEVTACAGDSALVGLTLLVTNAARGSITWQRDVECQLQPPPTTR